MYEYVNSMWQCGKIEIRKLAFKIRRVRRLKPNQTQSNTIKTFFSSQDTRYYLDFVALFQTSGNDRIATEFVAHVKSGQK